VASAGGLVVQAFPHTTEEAIAAMEQRIREAPPLSTLLDKMEIEDVVATLFHGVGYKQIDAGQTIPVSYTCQCTRERALAGISFLGAEEIQEIIDEGGTEVACQFCGRKYQFSAEDLLALTAKHEA
jgi:molecular chaperone Hsp33